jgi:hypothetical protein
MMTSLPFNELNSMWIFVVATDTTSKLANLAPAKHKDPSDRVTLEGMELFPPFSLIKTIDVWWFAVKDKEVPEDGDIMNLLSSWRKTDPQIVSPSPASAAPVLRSRPLVERALTLKILETPDLMSRFGRPFFLGFYRAHVEKKLFKTGQTEMNVSNAKRIGSEELLNLLKKKILGGILVGAKWVNMIKITSKPAEFTKAQALAVLGSIVSIHVHASAELALELACEHMRIVAAISDHRKCVFTLEVPEPYLALAAHRIIMQKILTWDVVLRKLSRAILRVQ